MKLLASFAVLFLSFPPSCALADDRPPPGMHGEFDDEGKHPSLAKGEDGEVPVEEPYDHRNAPAERMAAHQYHKIHDADRDGLHSFSEFLGFFMSGEEHTEGLIGCSFICVFCVLYPHRRYTPSEGPPRVPPFR